MALRNRHTTLTDNGRLRCMSTKVEGVHVLDVCGEIDFAVRNEFKSVLNTVVASAQAPLVVDLTAVRYIDSSGFAELISAWKQMVERRERFYVVSGPNVRRLLRILGLDRVFDQYSTQRSAIASALRDAGGDPCGLGALP